MKELFLFFLTISLCACGPATLYEAAHQLPESGWSYADVADFSFTVSDTSQAYDLHLQVDHQSDFAYQNFYVRLFTTLPSGTVDTQRVSLQLAGDFGAWLGNCGNDNCTLDIPIGQNIVYRTGGEYGLRVEQYSRDNPLVGISKIGFAVREHE